MTTEKTMKVLMVDDSEAEQIRKRGSEQAERAELIIHDGKVIKNAYGPIYREKAGS